MVRRCLSAKIREKIVAYRQFRPSGAVAQPSSVVLPRGLQLFFVILYWKCVRQLKGGEKGRTRRKIALTTAFWVSGAATLVPGLLLRPSLFFFSGDPKWTHDLGRPFGPTWILISRPIMLIRKINLDRSIEDAQVVQSRLSEKSIWTVCLVTCIISMFKIN